MSNVKTALQRVKTRIAPAGKLVIELSVAPNLDYPPEQQGPNRSTSFYVVKDLKSASLLYRSLMSGLGGGNLQATSGNVYGDKGKAIAHVSYNGRVWEVDMQGKYTNKEIKVAGYTGNPDGKDIYPNDIAHGYGEPLAGGTDVMRKLQNQLLHEQGNDEWMRPESPRLAGDSGWHLELGFDDFKNNQIAAQLYGEYTFYLAHMDDQKAKIRSLESALNSLHFNQWGVGLYTWPRAKRAYLNLCAKHGVKPETNRLASADATLAELEKTSAFKPWTVIVELEAFIGPEVEGRYQTKQEADKVMKALKIKYPGKDVWVNEEKTPWVETTRSPWAPRSAADETLAELEKAASGRTTHYNDPKKPGYSLCGQRAYPDTTVDSIRDTTCYYCKLEWERRVENKTWKTSRFEEGKPADPCQNMSDEDCKKWKDMNEEHGDKFKTAADRTLAELTKTAGDMVVTSKIKAFLPKVIAELEKLSGVDSVKKGTGGSNYIDVTLTTEGGSVLVSVQLWGDPDDVETVLVKGKTKSGVSVQLETEFDAKDIATGLKAALKKKGIKIASSDNDPYVEERLSRFEEGVPADPTENMSDEDAKEWKKNTETYGDKFKTASWKPPAINKSLGQAVAKTVDRFFITELLNDHLKGKAWQDGIRKALAKAEAKKLTNMGAQIEAQPAIKAWAEKISDADLAKIRDWVEEIHEKGKSVSYKTKPGAWDKTAAVKTADKLFRYPQGVFTEKDWVRKFAIRIEETKGNLTDLFNRGKFNRMDNADEQSVYEKQLKEKSAKPVYRAWYSNDSFVQISKATYLWAKQQGIGKTASDNEFKTESADEVLAELELEAGMIAPGYEQRRGLRIGDFENGEVTDGGYEEGHTLPGNPSLEGKRAGSEVGMTILQQMGGVGRLRAMLGVKQFVSSPDGISFTWPSQQRSKGNGVRVVLTPADTYNMIFYTGNRIIKEYNDVYADMLIPIFERQTGYYLKLGSAKTAADETLAELELEARFEEGKPADPKKQMKTPEAKAKWEKYEGEVDKLAAFGQDIMEEPVNDMTSSVPGDPDPAREAMFEKGVKADPTKNMTPEQKTEWNKQKELHKDEFKTAAVKTLWVALKGNALKGASKDQETLEKRLGKTPGVKIRQAENVPDAIAKRCIGHGTGQEWYADDEEAFEAVRKYIPATAANTRGASHQDEFKTAAAAVGKAQQAIVQWLKDHDGEAKDYTAFDGSLFRGIHYGDILNALEVLIKKGIVERIGSKPSSGNTGGKLVLKKTATKTARISDDNTLLKLLKMQIDSIGGDAFEARVTSEMKSAARNWEDIIKRLLMAWVMDNLDKFNLGNPVFSRHQDARNVVEVLMVHSGGAGFLYYLEMGEEGAGTLDGGWDGLFVDKKTIKELSLHMRTALRNAFNTMHSAIENAAADAAAEADLGTRTAADYSDYLKRKHQEGEKPLPKDKWEARVKGTGISNMSGDVLKKHLDRKGVNLDFKTNGNDEAVIQVGEEEVTLDNDETDSLKSDIEDLDKKYEDQNLSEDEWDDVAQEKAKIIRKHVENQLNRSERYRKQFRAAYAEGPRAAGKSVPVRYTVRLFSVFSSHGMTTQHWDKIYGKPNVVNLKKFVDAHNASLEPGGVNSHAGRKLAAYGGEIYDNFDNKKVVARWEDKNIIQFYKSQPAFEVVTKTAGLATGLYGFPKYIQADCDGACKKLTRSAETIAKAVYRKDEKTAEFLATHSKRAESISARLLVAALQGLSPKVASSKVYRVVGDNVPKSDARREDLTLEEAIALSKKYLPGKDDNANQIQWSSTGKPPWEAVDSDKLPARTLYGSVRNADFSLTPADKKVLDAFIDQKVATSKALSSDGKTLDGLWMGGKKMAEWLGGSRIQINDNGGKSSDVVARYLRKNTPKNWLKEASMDMEAAKTGLYGFHGRTAKLGLQACTDLRHEAGKIANDLHARRASHYEKITGFLNRHAEEGGCHYSRMIASSYPEANSKTASMAPKTVADWIKLEN